MKRPWDWSVGQRLGLGFGIVLLLMVLVAATTIHWGRRIDALRAQSMEVVEPRSDVAHALETAVLSVGLDVRTFVVSHEPADAQRALGAQDRARRLLADLRALPMDPDGRALVQAFEPLATAYLDGARAQIAAEQAGINPEDSVKELYRLTGLRLRLLSEVRRFAELQDLKTEAIREAISGAQKRMRLEQAAVLGAVLAIFLATAFLVVRAVRRPAVALLEASRALGRGDYAPARELVRSGCAAPAMRDELRELSYGFGQMAGELQSREERLASAARVAEGLARSLEPEKLAGHALGELVSHLGAVAGAVYLLDDDGAKVRRVASRALDGTPASFGADEGVIGQALRGEVVAVCDIPAESPFQVRFGFDAIPPRTVVAAPIGFGPHPLGVLVLASLGEVSGDCLDHLKSIAGQLGVSLQNALAHRRVESLARELQRSNEQLQGQNEQLQVQSEELQAQSEELQAQGEELQAQNEELHAQSEQLRLQAEELQGADRRKDEFLAMLSHELRNPLAAINSSIFVVQRRVGDRAAVTKGVGVIGRQVAHLVRIVDDLLDITRVTSGKFDLRRDAVDLAQVVRHTVEGMGPQLESRGHRVAVTLPDVPVPLHGDAARLEQVLSNLLHNASKYTDPGERIEVRLDVGGGEALLRVIDEGAGISRDLLPRVFELFTQADRSLARSQGGLGIGLTMVRKLVQMHGGTVEAHSDGPGRGSQFLVRLPLRVAALPSGRSDAAGLAVASAEGGAVRVLLVEDNLELSEAMVEILQDWGHSVYAELDGPRALARAAEVKPDVVLLDIGLPGMDGYEVARRMRADPGMAGVRLVALTGYGQPQDRRLAQEAGFDLHLVKPVDFDALRDAVESARSGGAQEDASSAQSA